MTNATISLPIPSSRRISTKQSIAHAFRFPDKYTFQDAEGTDLGRLVDGYGYSANGYNSKLFAICHEYGYCHLVHCDNESEAWETSVDESSTIAEDEVIEAYGFYLMQAKSCFSPDCGEPWYVLCDTNFHENDIGEVVSESVLKCTGDRLTIGVAFSSKEDAITFCLEFIRERELDLVEGCEYQSNDSGTGIVNTGHYGHMREVAWSDLVVTRKA